MQKAEAQVDNTTTVEVDFTEMEKRLMGNMDEKMKGYMKELKEWREQKSQGKGIVETFMPDDKKKMILEEFAKGEKMDYRKVAEQWTIAVPKGRIYETAAHLRDFVFVSDVIKGKPGETVTIPYVKDLDFEHVSTAGYSAFSAATTGLVSTLTTTLHECGAYYDAYYHDIEKIDSNLLDELNSVMAHAAVRAEDWDLISLVDVATTSQFGETGFGSANVIRVGDHLLAGSTFNLSWVADAIGMMLRKGKDVHPGELLLYLNPTVYGHFLRKITLASNTAIGFARPDVYKTGIVEEYLGVRVITGSHTCRSHRLGTGHHAATSYQVSFLMRPKRALALCPKRDILIETDKLIATRQLRIAASHTYGVAAIDLTEAQPIVSGIV